MNKCKIIGKKFGGLKVLKTVRVTLKSGNRSTKYEVECVKCKSISLKNKSQLDRFKAEGCMKCTKKTTRKPKLSISERNYKNYKNKILSQTNKSFELTFKEFDNLTRRNCYYCNAEPIFPERFKNEFKNREIEYFNGVDRIDSAEGYYLDNCVPCCSTCNRMKSDFSKTLFLEHIQKIYDFNQSPTTSPLDVGSSDPKRKES